MVKGFVMVLAIFSSDSSAAIGTDDANALHVWSFMDDIHPFDTAQDLVESIPAGHKEVNEFSVTNKCLCRNRFQILVMRTGERSQS